MPRTIQAVLRFSVPGLVLALFCACHGSNSSQALAQPPLPSFNLTVTPSTLSIPAGGSGYVTVTVTRGSGFNEAITLSLDAAPTGVVASGTLAANAQTAQVSIFIAREMPPQSLEILRVKGTSTSQTQTGIFKLIITAPLPVGQISSDLVQASGGTQRGSGMENTGMATESVKASTSKDASGTMEVRHGFMPAAKAN